MRTRSLCLATALVLFGVTASYGRSAADQWIKAFMAEPSSDQRRQMLGEIPADKGSKAVGVLLTALADDSGVKLDWWVRDAGISALSRLDPGDRKVLKLLDKILKKPRPQTAAVRSAILAAFGRTTDPVYLDRVVNALGDPQASVRRTATFALRQIRDVKGVEALMERLGGFASEGGRRARRAEPDGFRELMDYTRALADLTPEDHGQDVAKWLEYWAANADGFKLREDFTDADRAELAKARKQEAKKARTTTVARGVTLEHTTAGRGKVKLLVIHDDAWDGDYFEPWLSPLHDVVEITYVRLPEIDAFDEKQVKIKRTPGGMAYMPVDALVDAFDEIRREKGFQRFALMAHGFSSLVAARYVTRHPDKVSHLSFLCGLTGDSAYGNILNEMERFANNVWQDKETTNMIMNHYIDDEKTGRMIYEPADEAEAIALQRKAFDLYWADCQDPAVGEMWEICRKPVYMDMEKRKSHVVISPEFDISREKKPSIPVLVMVGKKSLWTSVVDNERLAKNYPQSRLVVFENSGMFPFIEEADRFQAEMRQFLGQ